MIPPFIVKAAEDRGINLLAITDHNASANVAAVQRAARGTSLTVLPGMELQTREEVHLLCLFDTLEQLEQWQEFVDQHMPPQENNIEFFGEQFVVDEAGDFVRRETQLLLTSADIDLARACDEVIALGGLPIPAHVDRKAFSLLANLGFVPPDLPILALEVSRHTSPDQARQRFPQISEYPMIQNGDAHRLSELLGANRFTVKAPIIEELKLALLGKKGRSVLVTRSLAG
jgi:3',5'-nucleoside bisphosphate phosphatase